MIALNEIIDSRQEFEKQYALRGKKIDLSYFVYAEKFCRNLQQQAELARADCNKLCASFVGSLENNNGRECFKKIKHLDRRANKLQKKLLKMTAKVERKLQKLPNAQVNPLHFSINSQAQAAPTKNNSAFQAQAAPTKEKTSIKLSDLESFLEQNFIYKNFFSTSRSLLNSFSHFIMGENEFPLCFKTTDKRFVILTKDFEFEENLKLLFDFFSGHATRISQISPDKLKNYSASAYLIELGDGETLTVNIVGEYFTREFKIKYKNSSIDMTKFVSEIDIDF